MSENDPKTRPSRDVNGRPRTKTRSKRLFKRSGQDVWLTPKGRELVVLLGAEGASRELVAHRLGIAPSRFEEIMEKDERAALAYEQGMREHEHLVIKALTKQAVGDDDSKGVTAAAKELLEKVHGKAPEQASSVTIVLPGAQALDDFLARTKVIEHKGDDA